MVKFTTAVLVVLVLYSGLASGNLGLEEGDPCVETESEKHGVCALMSNCQAALNNWKMFRIRPTICGYVGGVAVVCCKGVQKKNISKRISQLKCEEYSKPVTETIFGSALTAGAEAVGETFSKCAYDKVELVVGGDAALPGQFPHMAAIGWPSVRGGYDFKCGGTLISESFVLTAGHCVAASSLDTEVTSIEPTIIRLGVLDLRPDKSDETQSVDARVGIIMKHPDYNPPATYNDIALLEMQRPVEFNSLVRPACLWQRDGFGGMDSGIITGWGAIAFAGARSNVLLKATLKLYSNEFCQPLLSALRNRKWKKGFSREQLCAGDVSGQRDSCQGDSGGPLQVNLKDNHCIFYVMGITSFGYDCGVINGPGVYTRVSSFIPWIESIVWPDGV